MFIRVLEITNEGGFVHTTYKHSKSQDRIEYPYIRKPISIIDLKDEITPF